MSSVVSAFLLSLHPKQLRYVFKSSKVHMEMFDCLLKSSVHKIMVGVILVVMAYLLWLLGKSGGVSKNNKPGTTKKGTRPAGTLAKPSLPPTGSVRVPLLDRHPVRGRGTSHHIHTCLYCL